MVGSALQVLISIPPLVDIFYVLFAVPPDTGLKAFDDAGCWILLIVSGIFFTFGSYIFVRAFEDPVPPPLFRFSRHLATDELAASWMYFFATAPAIPYSMVWLSYNPHRYQYWGAFGASCTFVAGSLFFVYTCYPSTHDAKANGPPPKPHLLRFVTCCCGANSSLLQHLKTDWLAACWFFFWSSLLWFVGSWLLVFSATNDRQIFAWVSSAADAFVYTVGSAYYVAGSYAPEESTNVNFDDPANYPPQMEYFLEAQGRKDFGGDVVYLDQQDTINILHDQSTGGWPQPWNAGQDEYYPTATRQQQQPQPQQVQPQQWQAPVPLQTFDTQMQTSQPRTPPQSQQPVADSEEISWDERLSNSRQGSPPLPLPAAAIQADNKPSPPKGSPAYNPFRVGPRSPSV